MSIRMDRRNYEFLTEVPTERAERPLEGGAQPGGAWQVWLAVEKYKKDEASLGRAAEVAGLPVGLMMMTAFRDFWG